MILKFKPQNCDKCDMYYIYCLRIFVLCIELPTCFTLFRLANLSGALATINTQEVASKVVGAAIGGIPMRVCFFEGVLFEILVLYFEIRV